jgi:3-phosphoshikimate 1-carboxyvinyltransferase
MGKVLSEIFCMQKTLSELSTPSDKWELILMTALSSLLPAINNEVIINGKGLLGLKEPAGMIDCGNSGTTMRLMSGVLSGQPFSSALTGDEFLLKRPMQRVIKPLSEMGAQISSEKGGYPPLTIKGGRLKPIHYNSPIASAQVKSAVLLAGLYCEGTTTVFEPGKSRDHTERMLRASGVEVSSERQKVSVKGIATLNPVDINIPGDFSSAAFFIVAGLLSPGSEILIKNVGINDTRTGLISILQDMMGTSLELLDVREISGEPVADILVKHTRLKGINIGSDRVLRAIDEFPVLCVAAAKAEGITKITGAGELRVKESDRISSMASELEKMGVQVEELEDGLVIEGREKLASAVVDSHGDHRVAMSLAVAGLAAEGVTTIIDTECVNTSFPGYMKMLEKLQK